MRNSANLLPTNLYQLILVFLLVSGSLGTKRCLAERIKRNLLQDSSTWVGNVSWSCISEDFYTAHPNHCTKLVDSKKDNVSAASAETAVSRDINSGLREPLSKKNQTTEAKLFQPSIYAYSSFDTAWGLAKAAESEHKFRLVADDSTDMGLAMLFNSSVRMKYRGFSAIKQKGVENGRVRHRRRLSSNTSSEEVMQLMESKLDVTENFMVLDLAENFMESKMEVTENFMESKMEVTENFMESKLEVTKKTLRIGVPVKYGFKEFANMEWNPMTKRNASGICIEVFDMVMEMLPKNIKYEYIFYRNHSGQMNVSYDDLVSQVYLGKFDAVVGDVTMTPKRSLYVDFTVPYTEATMSMVVPVKYIWSPWTFLKPFPLELWFITGVFFLYTGFVIWMIEFRTNDSFRGPPLQQLGTSLCFIFSTMVFAHREKVTSNLSKIVLVIWLFVVLILTSSYTASLSMMLTVQKLAPTLTNLQELTKGDNVGVMGNYFFLRSLNIEKSKIKSYKTAEEFDEALTLGSSRGGINAMIAETPYIRVFLSKYPGKYTMIPHICKSTGFGFAFPKGSSLVPDISREILKYQEEIDKVLDYNEITTQDDSTTSYSLSLASLWGIFLLTGITSTFALTLFLIFFLYYHRRDLFTNNSGRTLWQTLTFVFKLFDQKEKSSRALKNNDMSNLNQKTISMICPEREIRDDMAYLT